jgi:cytochrome c-type biogenesis protein CcmH/NrfF
MRGEIRGMIERGMSGEEVIAAYVAEHGEKIRVAPVAAGFNLLAWLGPLFALVAASVLLLLLARRWQRRRPAHAGAAVLTPNENDPYVARLQQELKEME